VTDTIDYQGLINQAFDDKQRHEEQVTIKNGDQ